MKLREYKWPLLINAALAIGLIAFSQGLSFARWHTSAEVGEKINEHAILIGISGFGILCCAAVMKNLFNRMQALEEAFQRHVDHSTLAYLRGIEASEGEDALRKDRETVTGDQR